MWILKSTQGTRVKWWKLVLSKPQQLPSLWDNACCWTSCLTKEVLSCAHLNARPSSHLQHLLNHLMCGEASWPLHLYSSVEDLWNQRKKQILGTSAEDQQNSSGVIHQSYTVQQWSPIFMPSDSKAKGWLTWLQGTVREMAIHCLLMLIVSQNDGL